MSCRRHSGQSDCVYVDIIVCARPATEFPTGIPQSSFRSETRLPQADIGCQIRSAYHSCTLDRAIICATMYMHKFSQKISQTTRQVRMSASRSRARYYEGWNTARRPFDSHWRCAREMWILVCRLPDDFFGSGGNLYMPILVIILSNNDDICSVLLNQHAGRFMR